MLRNAFPLNILTPFPESKLEFVCLDIEFWILGTIRQKVGKKLAKD